MGPLTVRSMAASSSKSFSLKNCVDPCKAPRLLVLLMVLSNFRLFDTEDSCALVEDLVCRGWFGFFAIADARVGAEYSRTALLNILRN